MNKATHELTHFPQNDKDKVIAEVSRHLLSRLEVIGFGEVSVNIVVHDGAVRRVDFGEQQKVKVAATSEVGDTRGTP